MRVATPEDELVQPDAPAGYDQLLGKASCLQDLAITQHNHRLEIALPAYLQAARAECDVADVLVGKVAGAGAAAKEARPRAVLKAARPVVESESACTEVAAAEAKEWKWRKEGICGAG